MRELYALRSPDGEELLLPTTSLEMTISNGCAGMHETFAAQVFWWPAVGSEGTCIVFRDPRGLAAAVTSNSSRREAVMIDVPVGIDDVHIDRRTWLEGA